MARVLDPVPVTWPLTPEHSTEHGVSAKICLGATGKECHDVSACAKQGENVGEVLITFLPNQIQWVDKAIS